MDGNRDVKMRCDPPPIFIGRGPGGGQHIPGNAAPGAVVWKGMNTWVRNEKGRISLPSSWKGWRGMGMGMGPCRDRRDYSQGVSQGNTGEWVVLHTIMGFAFMMLMAVHIILHIPFYCTIRRSLSGSGEEMGDQK
ncbi:hypothetical protein J2129_002228 [Methanofollis sp. W23]|nr:hypothetical protein [Methanofollis sp. W23]